MAVLMPRYSALIDAFACRSCIPIQRIKIGERAFWIVVSIAFLIAIAMRLWGIERSSFWLDEIYTIESVSLPAGELIQERLSRTHSPLFFLMLKGLGIPVDSLFWVRLPSALIGALTTFPAALAGVAVLDRRAGVFAALIFAVTPMLIVYGQEARPYTGLLLGATLALWGAARVVRHPRLAAMSIDASIVLRGFQRVPVLRLRMAWAALLGGCVLAIYMMTLGLLVWLSICLSIVFLSYVDRRRALIIFKPLVRVQIMILFLVFPLLVLLIPSIYSLSGNYWVQDPNVSQIYKTVTNAYLFQFDDANSIYFSQLHQSGNLVWNRVFLMVLLLFIVTAGIVGARRTRGTFVVIAMGFVVPIAILAIVSLNTSVWITRYILVSTPAFSIILASGFSMLCNGRPGWFNRLGKALVVLTIILMVPQLRDLQDRDVRDWGPLVASLSGSTDRAILVPSWIQHIEIRHEWHRRGLQGEPPLVAGLEYSVPDFPSDVPPLSLTKAGNLHPDKTYIMVWNSPLSRAELGERPSCIFDRESGYVEIFSPSGQTSELCETSM
jgi:uncharacterized membrane protein